MGPLSTSICRSCRSQLSAKCAARSLSTSTRRQMVPPESPAYIDVPTSYQADLPRPRRQKGTLPVPRELFPASRPDKPSKEYLDNLTKSPLPKNVIPYEDLSELGKYRYRMAQLRKKHIREGLTELHQRKLETTERMEYRSHNRQVERARLLSQPPRIDAQMTTNTVPRAMQLARSSTPIADDLAAVKAIHEQKVANYNATVTAKTEERLDALHTLYMNARSFITTEEQLNAAIEEQFNADRVFRSDQGSGKSMWNRGPPDTIKDMITNSLAVDDGAEKVLRTINARKSNVRFQKDQDRRKKIAEKLSGGKI